MGPIGWIVLSIVCYGKRLPIKNSGVSYLLAGFGCIFAWGIRALHLFGLNEHYFAEITR